MAVAGMIDVGNFPIGDNPFYDMAIDCCYLIVAGDLLLFDIILALIASKFITGV